MVDLGLPELTSEQIEEASQAAENAARKHILSKVSAKQVEKLNISVEAEGVKPVNFTVEVELVMKEKIKGTDEKAIANQAVKEAFQAIEIYLRKLT